MNPGKIVRPSKMDDRTLFRFKPGYATAKLDTALDWSEWSVPGAQSQGFAAAVEMCNNNGHCRKFDAGTMCPSYRVTGDEQHLTRGRANTLRLALSGQLGPDALTSDAMYETLRLCVSCKGCKRECPTGVDMARMKIEFLHHYHGRHGWSLKDRLVAYPAALRAARVARRGAAEPARPHAGLRGAERDARSASRRGARCRSGGATVPPRGRRALPGRARRRSATSCCSSTPSTPTSSPRTRARRCACSRRPATACTSPRGGRRAAALLRPHLSRGRHGRRGARRGAAHARGARARTSRAAFRSSASSRRACSACATSSCRCCRARRPRRSRRAAVRGIPRARGGRGTPRARSSSRCAEKKALLHGHCHQKAFGAMPAVERALEARARARGRDDRVELLRHGGRVRLRSEALRRVDEDGRSGAVAGSACGRAGTLVVADGTSCRHQIRDGAGREAIHVARVLESALA